MEVDEAGLTPAGAVAGQPRPCTVHPHSLKPEPCGSGFRLSLQKPFLVPVREQLPLLQPRQRGPDLRLAYAMPLGPHPVDSFSARHTLFLPDCAVDLVRRPPARRK